MGRDDAPKQAPVFAYVFAHNPVSKKLHSGDPCTIGAQGAFHGAEIPFFLNIRSFLQTSKETALASNMSTYLRNFAHSGNPNVGPGNAANLGPVTHWPQYKNDSQNYLNLG